MCGGGLPGAHARRRHGHRPDRSVPWYTALFGAEPVLDEDTGPFRHVVWLSVGTLFGLHQFPELASAAPFDERRPGLDHVAFGCADRAELEYVAGAARRAGHRARRHRRRAYGSGLSFRDPDNIALEFFAPPG